MYEIDDDEALVVEFPVPADCFYWQILVADDRFATVDWVNRQSSLNDHQARIDPDGWFRGVVSKQDPGVHNWLDKADWPWGILQARFYRSNEYPDCTVTRVKWPTSASTSPTTPRWSPRRSERRSSSSGARAPRDAGFGEDSVRVLRSPPPHAPSR